MKSLTLFIAICCFVVTMTSAQTAKPTTPANPSKAPAASTTKPKTTTKPSAPASSPKAPANGSLANHYLVKYATASRWNDKDVARDALYDLIIENPADSLIFTLAYSYFDDQNYLSAALVSQD